MTRFGIIALSFCALCAPSAAFAPPPAAKGYGRLSSSVPPAALDRKQFDVAEYVQSFDVSSLAETFDGARKNAMEGELGSRGEVYTVAQFFVLFTVLIGGVPFVGSILNLALGPGLMIIGVAVLFFSLTDLGKSLSPWPASSNSTELVTDGMYSQVRHPTYAGLLATCAGLAILSGSADRLLLTALLLYVLDIKSNYEEQDLIKKFPEEYPAYQRAVSNKFFPQSVLDLMPWTNEESP